MLSSLDIARLLIQIKAISINVTDPFRYSSGLLSPIYCDNRLLISYPELRTQVVSAFIDQIKQNVDDFDVVAGTATAGIPHAAWIADKLNKPMVYVRSSAKGHGKHNEIEGRINAGQTAIIIEDHISTGGSALHAAKSLRQAGALVEHCFAISTYNFDTANKQFSEEQVTSHCLTDFNAILKAAVELNQLDESTLALAEQWNQAPKAWEALFNAHNDH